MRDMRSPFQPNFRQPEAFRAQQCDLSGRGAWPVFACALNAPLLAGAPGQLFLVPCPCSAARRPLWRSLRAEGTAASATAWPWARCSGPCGQRARGARRWPSSARAARARTRCAGRKPAGPAAGGGSFRSGGGMKRDGARGG